jgi:hypothetical protein
MSARTLQLPKGSGGRLDSFAGKKRLHKYAQSAIVSGAKDAKPRGRDAVNWVMRRRCFDVWVR